MCRSASLSPYSGVQGNLFPPPVEGVKFRVASSGVAANLSDVRGALLILFSLVVAWPHSALAEARVIKVLPHFLDAKGRHTLGPSLFERDAYQAQLRDNPEQRSALRFDVNWKTPLRLRSSIITLRLELRTSKTEPKAPIVLEQRLKGSGLLGAWSQLTLDRKRLEEMGDLVAWRATLWAGDEQLSEARSFLW